MGSIFQLKTNPNQVKDALCKLESNPNREHYLKLAWDGLSSGEKEVLNQLLHTGPVYDGNVASKSGRDSLIDCGLAGCCFMGEVHGYTAGTYLGLAVFKSSKTEPFQTKPGSPA